MRVKDGGGFRLKKLIVVSRDKSTLYIIPENLPAVKTDECRMCCFCGKSEQNPLKILKLRKITIHADA
ncbi:MAG: hypothetical protein IJY35_07130 [Clostridia bacterium]|nr:hypothetical protein [Clostridia bacterium]